MNDQQREIPGILTGLVAMTKRDLLLAWKRPGDVLNPLFFFAMVCTLFPLAVGPSLFITDFEDGSLDQLLVSPQPLPVLVLGKTLAHWMTSGLPLVFVSPILAITYRMPLSVVGVMMLTLALGTISLSLLGSIGAALTVGLHRGTALLSLLILPLAMPIMILGANAVSLAAHNDIYTTGIWALGAYAIGSLSLAPYATAAALRISNE